MSDTSGPAEPPRDKIANAKTSPVDPGLIQRTMQQLGAIVRGQREAIFGRRSDNDVPPRLEPVIPPPEWFGPRKPQTPLAPEGAAVGRQFDYPTGYNLTVRPRSYETIDFTKLRELGDAYDLLRLCIETRKDQLSKVSWKILPKKEAGRSSRARADERCERLQKFFLMPDRQNDWFTWLRMLLEDMFVIDAPTIYVRKTLDGNDIWALEVMDGATIKRIISEDGRTPLPPEPAYQQILKGMPAVDYTTDEIIYRPRNPRSWKVYGYSPVEQVLMTVNIALRRQVAQMQFYTEGNIPEALAGVPPEWTPKMIEDFQRYWDSVMEGNTASRRHMKFVPGGIQVQQTRGDGGLMDQFDEWLARVVCYAFSLPPLPFVKQVNRATAETAQEAALEEGLEPIMKWVKDLIDFLILKYWGYSDLEFTWDDDELPEPEELVGINTQYVSRGIKHIDEARMDLGLEPYGIEPIVFGVGPAGFLFLSQLKDPALRDIITGLAPNPAQPQVDPMTGQPIGGPGAQPGGAPGAAPGGAGPGPLSDLPPELLEAIGMTPDDVAAGGRGALEPELAALAGKAPLAGIPDALAREIGMGKADGQRGLYVLDEPVEEHLTKMADTVARMVAARLPANDQPMEKREPEQAPVTVNVAPAQVPRTTTKRIELVRSPEGKIVGANVIEEAADVEG